MTEFPSWAGLAPEWFYDNDNDDDDFDDYELLGDYSNDLFEYDDDDWYDDDEAE